MGVSADVTGTTVKRIYTNINKGSMATAKQQQAFARLGMTAEGVAKAMQVDGTGTLLNIFEAIGKLQGNRSCPPSTPCSASGPSRAARR